MLCSLATLCVSVCNADHNADGYISPSEMVLYLSSVFKVMYATHEGTGTRLGVNPEELAQVTAQQCFADADVDGDGRYCCNVVCSVATLSVLGC